MHQWSELQSPTAVVHKNYDIDDPPPKPADGEWTRFICISDTHSHTFHVPDGDVLLHSGDLTGTGTLQGFKITFEWLYRLPHKHKIVIAGNHDLPLDKRWYDINYPRFHGRTKMKLDPILQFVKGPRAKAANVVYIEDQTYHFQAKEGGRLWSVYGSPWSPEFFNWAFNYERGVQADRVVKAFPKADILLTHGPPKALFDKVTHGPNVGCEALAARLPTLRPRLHVFGHIHEARDAEIRVWPSPSGPAGSSQPLGEKNSSDAALDAERTVFVNAANQPAGPGIPWTSNKFGTDGWMPVIVDLLDTI
ncbi:hypothetical protein PLICRDRAFT_38759 [Plicaturopsis crispa FD-325 SS-3]|nr:hypothetical protein PLICRDRAFT_38759 [Plicaturopsis crispa FD-325 SS-3]